MKTLKNFLIHLLLILPLTSFSQASKTGNLNVKINGLENKEGSVKILLHFTEKTFPFNERYAFFSITKDLSAETAAETFNILFGEYAVVAWHDKNNNGRLDRNWWGTPCEPLAFSMMPAGYCGSPSFSQCAFNFQEDGMTIPISLYENENEVSKTNREGN